MTDEIIEAVHVIEKRRESTARRSSPHSKMCSLAATRRDRARRATRRSSSTTRGLPRLLGRAAARHRGAPHRGGPRARDDELEALEAKNGERCTRHQRRRPRHRRSEIPPEQVKRADVTLHYSRRHRRAYREEGLPGANLRGRARDEYDEYVDRVTEVVTGIVQQAGDCNKDLVDLGKVEALLPRSEQADGERYEQGSRIKAVMTEARSGTKGPQAILSRRDPEPIRTLSSSRRPRSPTASSRSAASPGPGYRSKIAVEPHAEGVDPVGACVGPRGSRVRMVASEFRARRSTSSPGHGAGVLHR